MDYAEILYGDKKTKEKENEREKLENQMLNMFVNGNAGKGNKLTYEQAKWWWRNAGGKPLVVDGRELSVWDVGAEIAAPFPLDDLKVHGHVQTSPAGRIYDGKYDFAPEVMKNPDYELRVYFRNWFNKQAIEEHGPGTPFEIEYRYEDTDFE